VAVNDAELPGAKRRTINKRGGLQSVVAGPRNLLQY
jgi:hypothetical protein